MGRPTGNRTKSVAHRAARKSVKKARKFFVVQAKKAAEEERERQREMVLFQIELQKEAGVYDINPDMRWEVNSQRHGGKKRKTRKTRKTRKSRKSRSKRRTRRH